MRSSLQLIGPSTDFDTSADAALLERLCPSTPSARWATVLEANGGLRGLVATSDALLSQHLPRRAIAALRAAFLLNERFRASSDGRPYLPTPQSIYEFVRPHLDHHRQERFVVLSLNARNRLLRMETVAEGSVDQCHVDPRQVFKTPLLVQATGVVLVHQHPSGDAEPSTQDVALTRQLREGGRSLCIRVLDHLVLGESSYVSMLARGLLRGEH